MTKRKPQELVQPLLAPLKRGASWAKKILSRLGPAVLFYWLISTALTLYGLFSGAGLARHVITENDNAMRLVEVRDLLAGQPWFDLMQYRLGLGAGTPMHWSRLVDLPIAGLIRFFGLFLAPPQAEAAATTAWPILLSAALLWPLALGARRIARPEAAVPVMHIALGLGVLFILSFGRFSAGYIDHHNVQLVLAMWIAAMLSDPRNRPASAAIAGLACALAVAIGAETSPYVAVACAVAALQWVWHGGAVARQARTFGLSLAGSVTAFFFLTVPPRDYTLVTCDSLSFGFFALCALGGTALFLLASLANSVSRPLRILYAILTGGLLALAARLIAPQCLGNPLATLDPLLVELWLNNVTEARSFLAHAAAAPETLGAFYGIGLFAIIVCLCRVIRKEQIEFHLIFLALTGVCWAVALLQVRGFIFANLLAILPLSLLIGDIRQGVEAEPRNKKRALGYAGAVLASVPMVWLLLGIAVVTGPTALAALGQASGEDPTAAKADMAEIAECSGPADMAALAALEPGLVAASSNSGADILRDTAHRVLSAPYHRNQEGMLRQLHIALAPPAQAQDLLESAGVTILTFCASDPHTALLIERAPEGLYARLAHGAVPDYLHPVAQKKDQTMHLYYVDGN